MNKRSVFSRGVQDGIVSAMLMYVLNEYAASVWYSNTWHLVVSVIAIFLSISAFLLFAKYTNGNIFRYYGIGRLSIFFSLLILFVNNLTFRIHLFPRRALSNADGLVLLAVCGSYLLCTELLRLAFSFLIFLYERLRSKIE